jgi:transcriptional regulator with XRE-family HTH domain
MNTTLAERISFVLKNSKLNQTQFAEKIGISQQYLSQMCNGKKTPSDRTIGDIAREFNCNEVWLQTGKGDPFKERSQEEKIMRFAVQTNKGSDDFRKAYVAMLADLSDEGWKGLQEMYDKLSEIYKKE